MRHFPRREQGAALLSVLILVGVMGAIAATMLDRMRLATLLAANAFGQEQARAYALVGETLAIARIDDLLAGASGKTTLRGGWNGRTTPLPLPAGLALARVSDGGNCFNLNSLVVRGGPEQLASRPIGIGQFAALMDVLEVAPAAARRIAASAADFIDSDDGANREGAEDSVYARARVPYRTSGTLMAEASELRAVDGMTPTIHQRLKPWLCALPLAELSPLNVNTLAPAQAPLLAMLLPESIGGPQQRLRLAQQALAERPAAGWDGAVEFANTPALRDSPLAEDALQQLQVRTRWFALALRVETGETILRETALVDARQSPARIAARRWTGED